MTICRRSSPACAARGSGLLSRRNESGLQEDVASCDKVLAPLPNGVTPYSRADSILQAAAPSLHTRALVMVSSVEDGPREQKRCDNEFPERVKGQLSLDSR